MEKAQEKAPTYDFGLSCSSGDIKHRIQRQKGILVSLPGFEPGTFGLEVQRAIHCANGTQDTHWLLNMLLFRNAELVCTRIKEVF